MHVIRGLPVPILSVRCDDEDHARLKAAAAALGISMSEFVRTAARRASLEVLEETIRGRRPPPSDNDATSGQSSMDDRQEAAWLREVLGWE